MENVKETTLFVALDLLMCICVCSLQRGPDRVRIDSPTDICLNLNSVLCCLAEPTDMGILGILEIK